jgi:nitrate/TMAO reductase-like tetraheme cytochrome c subunit
MNARNFRKPVLPAIASLSLLAGVFFFGGRADGEVKISTEGEACVDCHTALSPAFVQEWKISRHAQEGVDCYTCHQADKSDPDGFEHNGSVISLLVTPEV